MSVEDTTEYPIDAPREAECPTCGGEIYWLRDGNLRWVAYTELRPHRCPEKYDGR